jgi:hypothetical protein
MSMFQQQATVIARLTKMVEQLRSRVNSAITTTGNVIITEDNRSGGMWSHDHSNAAGGGLEAYTEGAPANWNGALPATVWAALDQLASRIKSLENLNTPATAPAANTLMFNLIE